MENNSELFDINTNKGNNIGLMSREIPLLLVFLRHFGCAFCRKSMLDLSKKRNSYEKKGVKLIFFHLSDDKTAIKYFKKFKLEGVEFVSDPNCIHYAAFGLTKGTFNQLLGFRVLMKGIPLAFDRQIRWGNFIGDGFQMPGVFLVQDESIKSSFIHKYTSDEPDYDKLIACCVVNTES